MATYPGGIKTWTPVTNNLDTVKAEHINGAYEEIIAIETTLKGNETVTGIKTFSSSPIVPTPSSDAHASTKKYVDDLGEIVSTKSPSANPTFTGTVTGVKTTYTATLPSASWTGSSSPYSKAVTVTGILATDTPLIDIVPTGTYATDVAIETNWVQIYRIVASLNTITFYAHAIPTADIPLQVLVVR